VQRHAPRRRGAAQQPVHEQQVGHQLEPAVVQHHHNLLAASRLERRAQLARVVGEHLAARVGQLGRVARAAAARRRVGGRDERRARGEGEVGEVAPQRGAHERRQRHLALGESSGEHVSKGGGGAVERLRLLRRERVGASGGSVRQLEHPLVQVVLHDKPRCRQPSVASGEERRQRVLPLC